jgi:hypothetical protein
MLCTAVAFPPVGRLGLTSPPLPVLYVATTALCPSRGLRLSLAFPIPYLLPCLWSPKRTHGRVEAPDHTRVLTRNVEGVRRASERRSPGVGVTLDSVKRLVQDTRASREAGTQWRQGRWEPTHGTQQEQPSFLPGSGSSDARRLNKQHEDLAAPQPRLEAVAQRSNCLGCQGDLVYYSVAERLTEGLYSVSEPARTGIMLF